MCRDGGKQQSLCVGMLLCWLWLIVYTSSAYQSGNSLDFFHAEEPVLITSCGQTPDAFAISAIAKHVGLTYRYDDLMVASYLEGYRTMIVAMGASLKGLGEAGLSVSDELSRVSALLNKAGQENIKVIAVHIGGKARRGGVSESFIDLVVQHADCIITTFEGNNDDRFLVDAKKEGIPLYIIRYQKEIESLLEQIFK